MDVNVISNLVAEVGVDALISVEPVIATMDKSRTATYTQKTFQSGDTIRIRLEDQPQEPTQSNVIQLDPVVQSEISVTVLQYNDGMLLGSIEELYNLGGKDLVEKRIAKPRMENLAVKAASLSYFELATCSNFFGTAGTALRTSADWGAGQAVLNDQLANDTGLYAAMSNQSMNETAGSLAAAFNPTTESATAYMKGRVKEASNLNFYSTSNIPNHTNGTAVGNGTAGMIVSTTITTGATSVTVSGGTANGTITANSLIWFKGGFAVQPNTKKTLSTLRYYNVVADATLSAGGAGSFTVYPAIYGPENPKLQNISVLPTGATTFFVGIVGLASHTYEQALVYKKNAAAFFGLPLPKLVMQQTSVGKIENVEIIVSAGSDIRNYQNIMRWDMLVAPKITEWRHVARAYTRDLG
jgi:hypothetical protein